MILLESIPFDWSSYIAEQGPLVAVLVGVIWGFYKFVYLPLKLEKDKLEIELKEYGKDYRSIAENAIKVVTLADARLSDETNRDEKVNDIHRMVAEILEIERRRGQNQ